MVCEFLAAAFHSLSLVLACLISKCTLPFSAVLPLVRKGVDGSGFPCYFNVLVVYEVFFHVN